jgi:hypothetical protein
MIAPDAFFDRLTAGDKWYAHYRYLAVVGLPALIESKAGSQSVV